MSNTINKPTIFMMVGAPGSGKSTWWEDAVRSGRIDQTKAVRINMDTIRKELTGNAEDQSKNGMVARIADQNLVNALSHRIPVIVWDNTSARPKYRKNVIKEAQVADYDVVCVYFDLDLETVQLRNELRERVVPKDVVERIYNSIQQNPPTEDEGFSQIIRITE